MGKKVSHYCRTGTIPNLYFKILSSSYCFMSSYYLCYCCSFMILLYFVFCLLNVFLLCCSILFLIHPFLYFCRYSDFTLLELKCNWKKSSFTLLLYNLIENVLLAYTCKDKMFLITQFGELSVLKLHRFEYNLMYLLKIMLLLNNG